MKTLLLALVFGVAMVAGGYSVLTGQVGLNQAEAGCLDQRQC